MQWLQISPLLILLLLFHKFQKYWSFDTIFAVKQRWDHFQVFLCLCFKTSLSVKLFIWKWVVHEVSFSWKSKSFSWECFRTLTCFETEVKPWRKNLKEIPCQNKDLTLPYLTLPRGIRELGNSHLHSLWNRGTRELSNGILAVAFQATAHNNCRYHGLNFLYREKEKDIRVWNNPF